MPKRATLPEANETLIGRNKGKSVLEVPAAVPQEQTSMVAKKQLTKVRKSEKTFVEKPSTPIVEKGENTTVSEEVEKSQKPKAVKTQISTYLTEETLLRLEEVKYRLRADHHIKAKKSDIMEVALVQGLVDPERLAQALRHR